MLEFSVCLTDLSLHAVAIYGVVKSFFRDTDKHRHPLLNRLIDRKKDSTHRIC